MTVRLIMTKDKKEFHHEFVGDSKELIIELIEKDYLKFYRKIGFSNFRLNSKHQGTLKTWD